MLPTFIRTAGFLCLLPFISFAWAQSVGTEIDDDDFLATLDLIVENASLANPLEAEFNVERSFENLIAQTNTNPFDTSNQANLGDGEGNEVVFDAEQGVTLNFQGADISALVALVAKVTGKNFIVDPRVKGKVTLVSGSPMPAEALYDVFLSVLATYNFAALPSGNLIKIIPANLVKQNPTPTITEGNIPNNEQEITYIVTLDHASVNEILPILRPLLPPTAHIAPHAGSNTLILTDRANNIRRVLALIERIDQEQQGQTIRVIYIKHADAKALAQVISQLAGSLNSDEAAKGIPVKQTLVQVDEGLNALILRAPDKDFPVLQALIDQLDVKRPEKGNVHVKYLNFAQAKDMVTLINGIIQDKQAETREGAAPSAKISVQAHETGNALVVRAEEKDYKDILGVIEQLDIRRSQVFVEAIIAEVSEKDEAQIGVDWTGVMRNSDGQELTKGAKTFGEDAGGFNLGFINKYVRTLGGKVTPDLQVVLNALRGDSNSNIISTPSMLTLDNEEAEIVVGQEVPFVTGRFTSSSTASTDGTTNTSGTVNPFQTIERKEVGLSLKITPQINAGGTIHLDIAQEISSISPATVAGVADLITDKRTIKAKVLVDDGQIIILGGLIRNDVGDTYDRIPILGDIPIIGQAFRKKAKRNTKTNLMVFLRPTIIREPSDLNMLTRDRYEYLRTEEEESLPDTRRLLKAKPPQLQAFPWEDDAGENN
ncbi:MAG: type II secretion system secretin GspD [Arenicellales bacterium]